MKQTKMMGISFYPQPSTPTVYVSIYDVKFSYITHILSHALTVRSAILQWFMGSSLLTQFDV
jgi:hypothetical protein